MASSLERIFEQGHRLACALRPIRHVMLVEERDERPTGYYFVSDEEVEAASVAGEIAFQDVGRRVTVKDLLSWGDVAWYPAVDHCWCDGCKGARQMRSTLSG